MPAVLTDEQTLLKNTAVRLLADRSGPAVVRSAMESGRADAEIWRTLVDAGLLGLGIAEKHGGGGGGVLELGLVLEEMGRVLAPVPYFETVALATPLLTAAGSATDLAELLPRLAGGQPASVALVDNQGGWAPEDVRTTYTVVPGGYRVSGDKVLVARGLDATAFVVIARREGTVGAEGLSVLWVDARADGIDASAMAPMDPTWPQARVRFRGVPARLVGDEGSTEKIRTALSQSTALLTAQMAGGAQMCLDMAVRYSLDRHQFGRPIASFQAVKHKAADMLFDADTCSAIARFAIGADTADARQAQQAASIAKAWCSDAFFRCAAANLQIHGGVGFTWEHACQLYYKRAKASAFFLGDVRYHRDRLAVALRLTTEDEQVAEPALMEGRTP
jgi:alkylation response protein AidB-like acyl-CoA dehydrogenase